MNQKPNQRAAETDPRFPSGSWVGFWLQRGMGKQRTNIAFTFREGRISGEGRDVIGRFTFAGTYDVKTGRCRMVKRYVGAHAVIYDGVSEGRELWLWGLWNVGGNQGGFHLWPEGESDPTQRRTSERLEQPLQRERQRVPADLVPF